MAIRLGSTVINCADMEHMTSFWSQALHLVLASDGDDFRVLRGDGVSLSLQLARTPVTARDQSTSTCTAMTRRPRSSG